MLTIHQLPYKTVSGVPDASILSEVNHCLGVIGMRGEADRVKGQN